MSKARPQDFETEGDCPQCSGTGRARRYSGARLRAHRMEMGAGLNETAHRMGRSGTYISQIELGRTQPPESVVREYLTSIDRIHRGLGRKDPFATMPPANPERG